MRLLACGLVAFALCAQTTSPLGDSPQAIAAAINAWESAHPQSDPTPAGASSWELARLAFLKRLHDQRPHSAAAIGAYLTAAFPLASALSTPYALEIADVALKCRKALPFDPDFLIAELYLHRRARLDQVPLLLNAAVQDVKARISAHTTAENSEAGRHALLGAQIRMHRDLAEYWLAKNNLPNAQAQARATRADLVLLTPGDDSYRSEREAFQDEQQLWLNLAKRVGIPPDPVLLPPKIDWSQANREALTNFDAVDLSSRHWTLHDLRGKATLVTTWATWCGPCRAELPYIQKLHQAFAGRNDRLVLTINIDSSEELARNMIREYGYTFPVIMSQPLATRINSAVSAPQNRFIDARTQLLTQPFNFDRAGFLSAVNTVMNRLN